ncbi:hypothetical protein NOX35_28595 (plasmid) [Comamonas sp. C11]|nr:hypothetical protein [Comamonas sp. C11]UUC96755.1 hypothetical protein NOX35_28595 [Comamonas sp. C11]
MKKIQGVDLVAACALEDDQLQWAHDELGVETTYYKDYKEMIDKEKYRLRSLLLRQPHSIQK